MEFRANEGKSVTIEVGGKTYARHAIQTHFVQVGESYIDLVEQYVKPVWQPGDLLSSSEKIKMCIRDRIPPSWWASCWTWRPRWSGTTSRRPPPTMWRSAWG